MGTVGLTIAGRLSSQLFPTSRLSAAGSTSKVVLVRNPTVIDSSGRVEQALLQQMLDRALMEFTGDSNVADSWKRFFSAEDTIGLKLNTLGLMKLGDKDLVSHYPSLAAAMTAGLKSAGVNEKSLVLWDRSDEELASAGFTPQHEKGKLRVIGTTEKRRSSGSSGFDDTAHPVGDRTSRVSRVLNDTCTSIINIPNLKHHSITGLTGALKTHYGSIDNPREFHDNGCTNPGIPEINAIPVIRKKQRLIIADALLGVFEGGPRWSEEYIWPYGGLLVGTDPVAVDSVMLQILDEKRTDEGLSRVEKRVKNYLELSEQAGLGTCDRKRIDLINIDMS